MDASISIQTLLQRLADREITPVECSEALQSLQQKHLGVGDYAQLDLGRKQRTGFPEVIYAPGKSEDEVRGILQSLLDHDRHNILVSRLQKEMYDQLIQADLPSHYYARSSTAVFGLRPVESGRGSIAIVTAGTSDLGVAEEVELACMHAGSSVKRFADVGVAGIDRLLSVIPDISRSNVCICVAGMEAALPSVLAGLVSIPVIGVPTSIGYGVNDGGINALLSMLGSCAPGVLTVNIDNGIGAAAAAHRINILIAQGGNERSTETV